MHKRTVCRLARLRGRAAVAVTPEVPPSPATHMEPPAQRNNLLTHIRQQMQRQAAMNTTTTQVNIETPTEALHPTADPLLTHLLAATRSMPTPSRGQQGKTRSQSFASPYLAREAAKADAQQQLGSKYRQAKAATSFDEIFPALGSGLGSWGGDGQSDKSKRRYMELLPHLNPLAASSSSKELSLIPSIPQQRSSEVSALATKMQQKWAELIRQELKLADGDAPLQKEAALASALESLTAGLNDSELLLAAKTGLLDIDALAAVDGENSANNYDEQANSPSSSKPTIAASVLPSDVLHELAHAATLSEWLTDASAVTLGGQPDDSIASLILRGQNPSNYSTFTEEEIQRLEAYEASRAGQRRSKKSGLLPGGDGGAITHTSSASEGSLDSATTNPFIGTNPVLHRLGTLDPAISESLFVMDRARLAALSDTDFQEALQYSNALYQREYKRQMDKAEMRALENDEVKELRMAAGRRMRVSLSRKQLDATTNNAGSSDGIGTSNASQQRARHIRQRYGNGQRMSHAVDMAKAMRVLNPQSSIRPEAATDIPYFFNPNTSIPPPSAGLNMALPNINKKGKQMVKGRTTRQTFYDE